MKDKDVPSLILALSVVTDVDLHVWANNPALGVESWNPRM